LLFIDYLDTSGGRMPELIKMVGNQSLELAIDPSMVEVEFSAWVPDSYQELKGKHFQSQVVTELGHGLYLVHWVRYPEGEPEAAMLHESWTIVVTDPVQIGIELGSLTPRQQAEFSIASAVRDKTGFHLKKRDWNLTLVPVLPNPGSFRKKALGEDTKLEVTTYRVSPEIRVVIISGREQGVWVETRTVYVQRHAYPELPVLGR
jgi:hypothetical protein